MYVEMVLGVLSALCKKAVKSDIVATDGDSAKLTLIKLFEIKLVFRKHLLMLSLCSMLLKQIRADQGSPKHFF